MEPIIEIEGLGKAYKKRKVSEYVHAVDHVSFCVNRNEIVGLLGPNGAGKSTMIKMMCGLIIPDSGTITINRLDVQKNRLDALHYISALLEGNRNLYMNLSVRENLEYFSENRGISKKEVSTKINKLLEQFNLKHKEKELVNRISRGMQQKLAISVTLLANSDIILLDEPTLGIDVETKYEIREILKNIAKYDNRTIIVSSHDMDIIQDLCERTIIMNHGRIITDNKVKNIMKLFEIRAYTISLEGELSEEQYQLLTNQFPSLVYKADTYQSILEIELKNSEEIYNLIDVLKMERTPIEDINRKTIDFEQVFIKIVNGEIEKNYHEQTKHQV